MILKSALRNCLAKTLYLSGLTSPARQLVSKLSVVTFHRVLPDNERAEYPYPGLVITPRELDAFLGFFTANFDCGTLDAQFGRFNSGAPSAKPLLALTFDDGQFDNCLHAQPILSRYGVKATFFVPVCAVRENQLLWHDQLGFSLQHLGRTSDGARLARAELAAAGLKTEVGAGDMLVTAVRGAKKILLSDRLRLIERLVDASRGYAPPEYARMMTPAEIVGLAGEGHEIGSHSMTHCLMPECDDAALEFETAESRRQLGEIISGSIRSFCYPNGDADERCEAAVAAAGYRCAVTTSHGANQAFPMPFRLARFDMDASRMRNSAGAIADHQIAFRLARK